MSDKVREAIARREGRWADFEMSDLPSEPVTVAAEAPPKKARKVVDEPAAEPEPEATAD